MEVKNIMTQASNNTSYRTNFLVWKFEEDERKKEVYKKYYIQLIKNMLTMITEHKNSLTI